MIVGFGKQKLLDVQHENKCSDSAQIFHEQAATEIWYDEKMGKFTSIHWAGD